MQPYRLGTRFPGTALLSLLLLGLPGLSRAQISPQRPDSSPATAADSLQARDSTARQATGSPVVVGQDTLFYIRERVGSFTAAERATAISSRLQQLAISGAFQPDSLKIAEGVGTTDLLFADRVILSVTDADARAAFTTRPALAAAHAAAIRRALARESFATRMRTILMGSLFALLTTLATILIFHLVQRGYRWLRQFVEKGRTTWMPSLHIQKLELLTATRMADFLLWLISVLRIVVLVLLLYATVPIILSFFPWTRSYADQLFGYIVTPFAHVWQAFLTYLPSLFTIGAIVVVTWYLLKLVRLVFEAVARGTVTFTGFFPEWAMPTYKLVRTLIMIFAFIMIWPYLPGSASPAFQGIGVMLGLLISFGSASAVGNIVGGIVLTYMRPFNVGDRVRIADTEGDVLARELLVTRVRTIKNVDITIPNAMVLGSHIVNYSITAREGGVILHTTVTIGYDAPWRQVHELLNAAARATDGIAARPDPFVLQTSLDDFYVSYELNAYTTDAARMSRIYSDLHANIQDRFNEAGVEIMSPHYRAARDGNTTTIPGTYLPDDYRAPAFRVEKNDT